MTIHHLPWRIALLTLVFWAAAIGCASAPAPTTPPVVAKTHNKQESTQVSQKRDPTKIYGNKALDEAYARWAKAKFPRHPQSSSYELDGKASWYGPGLNGNKTANGEVYDMYGMSAAHKKLPFGTIVMVTNKKNDKSVVVRINDRGPFIRGRIIDLSYGAAHLIDMIQAGVVDVRVDIIELGTPKKK